VGGFLGIVQTIYEDAFVLAMEPDGVKMEVQRDAISAKIEEVNYESGFEDAEPQQIEEDDEK
jgi:preprotein translocase subunit YajC